MTESHIHAVREAIQDAQPVQKAPEKAPRWENELNEYGLPKGCPVVPLGLSADRYFYLDQMKQLRELAAKDHSKLGLTALFGTKVELLWEFWPRLGKNGDVTGWRNEKASEQLMAACARQGVYDATAKVRGVGAWNGAEGELVLHCGDAIFHRGDWHEPGKIGIHVYPASSPQPRPAVKSADQDQAIQQLFDLLKSWQWRRGELDAYLLLGWMGAAILAGALDWRPMVWITGDKATGKSTLHKLINRVIEAILSVSDASAAGVWQKLGHSALPVAIDELEAEEDNRRVQNIIKLARQASSGGVVLRGGADHKGTEFTAQTCFLFSSILLPPMLGQDKSRLAILELKPLKSAAAPDLDAKKLSDWGKILRRRIVDQWPRLAGLLETYRLSLGSAGFAARASDQLGTLLAIADLLLHDHDPSGDDLEHWIRPLSLERNQAGQGEEELGDQERCLAHLLTSIVDAYRGGTRQTVHQLIQTAGRALENGAQEDLSDSHALISTFGLRIVTQEGKKYLAVANTHQGLAAIFKGTHWGDRSGATGVWVQSLRRMEGALAHGCIRFNGHPSRATLLPLDLILVPEGAQ